MKEISEIRLDNLEALVKEAGTAESLADRSGLSPVYISQIRGRALDAKTGKPRNLGSRAARSLEKGMGKPVGWMDRDHSGTPGHNGWPFPRIDPEKYNSLSEAQRNAIEDWVINQIAAFTEHAQVKSDDRKTA